MCFTINIYTTRDAIEKRFRAEAGSLEDYEFRYFYKAFDQPMIPVISQHEPQKVKLAQWGLIPNWARSSEHAEMIRKGTYNARAETIKEKPSFKNSFQNHRCWVLVRGFFEWQHRFDSKIPWYIKLKHDNLFALAGILSEWQNPISGEKQLTFAIVTTHANKLMEKIHNSKKRMPLILDEKDEQKWLVPSCNLIPDSIFSPFDQNRMDAYTISKSITAPNADPRNEHVLDKVNYGEDISLF